MNFLSLFVAVPVLTAIFIGFTRNVKQTRLVAAVGSGIQLVLAGILVYLYLVERRAGNMDEMLFVYDAL
jgi:NADH:ubiquinone oxidoreductase subunit 4 (subunit M)